jgi:hypothetical protein
VLIPHFFLAQKKIPRFIANRGIPRLVLRIFGMLDTNKKRLAGSLSDRYEGRPNSVCAGLDANRRSLLTRAAVLLMPKNKTIYPKTS